jgi:hypothetical protein
LQTLGSAIAPIVGREVAGYGDVNRMRWRPSMRATLQQLGKCHHHQAASGLGDRHEFTVWPSA